MQLEDMWGSQQMCVWTCEMVLVVDIVSVAET